MEICQNKSQTYKYTDIQPNVCIYLGNKILKLSSQHTDLNRLSVIQRVVLSVTVCAVRAESCCQSSFCLDSFILTIRLLNFLASSFGCITACYSSTVYS